MCPKLRAKTNAFHGNKKFIGIINKSKLARPQSIPISS